jgi:hypothetical protein
MEARQEWITMGLHEEDIDPETGATVPAECVTVREEVLAAVFGDGGAPRSEVLAHLEACGPCREWESEVRRIHLSSTSPDDERAPSLLIEDILATPELGRILANDEVEGAHRKAEKISNRALFGAVILSIVLFHAVLLLFHGGRHLFAQGMVFVAMLAATTWVYFDSAKRSMPIGFWTGLQPFTVPFGLIAYLVWRTKASARCPSCGRWVPAGEAYCRGCGMQLVQFCCGCGKPVRKIFHVCPHCGTPLGECFPIEDMERKACGWSPGQISFVIAVNVALLAATVACLIWGGPGVRLVAVLAYLLGYAPIFNFVSFDSRRRAMGTVAWGVSVLVTLYLGFLIYLASRWDARIVCPVCGSHPPASFNFCPCCGSCLGRACPKCGAAVSGDERFCAACGENLV